MSTFNESFGAQVRRYRKRLGLSQSNLASRINLSDEMIGKIERGVAGASFTTIESLCRVFSVSPSDLFPSEGYPMNPKNDTLGDIIIQLSKLNEAELVWVKSVIREVINRP
jgi:transcriptional regulator with XRE-family HTH domain